jgi:AraC-like DNA-binding protein
MARRPNIGISPRLFETLAEQFRHRWGIQLQGVAPDGAVVVGPEHPECLHSIACLDARRLAIDEAVRWGDPTVGICVHSRLLWAAPLMRNAAVLGGLIASPAERDIFPDGSGPAAIDVRDACTDLRVLTEQANLTNASYLATQRAEYHRQQKRAEAIHEFKVKGHFNLRHLYHREEPNLIAAIRGSDRPQAREILNRLLVTIHHYAGQRFDLIKAFCMELLTTMSRTAVESGGQPEQLLGANFSSFTELSHLTSMEQLAPWLHEMLERIMDCLQRQGGRTQSILVSTAMEYMAEHCDQPLSRDGVARVTHMSPSHFSRVFCKHSGRSFTDMLNQIRVDRAAELLRRTDRTLASIAIDVGFRDQSYFTKVFRRYMQMTPLQCRRDFLAQH